MKKFDIALQLYTIRNEIEEDMDASLQQVKEMGYDFVEFAGYFGKTATNVRNLLDKHGLKSVSVHQGYSIFLDEPEESVEYLKTIGAKYSAVPWMGKEKHKGSPEFAKTVEDFMNIGQLLQEAGITLLYHNHDFEFERYDGKFLLDWLFEAVPANILQTEIDTCWVKLAGYDPAEYIRQYTGRSPIVHLKDFTSKSFTGGPVYALIDESGKEGEKPSREDQRFRFRPVGQGVQNIPEILKAAEDAGTDIVVVEQDQCPDCSPMEVAKISRDYLRSLGL